MLSDISKSSMVPVWSLSSSWNTDVIVSKNTFFWLSSIWTMPSRSFWDRSIMLSTKTAVTTFMTAMNVNEMKPMKMT
eukprot:15102158-Heterocapsa_arctica.AAC.1